MTIENILQSLRADADFMRDVADWQRAPAQAARHAEFPSSLHASVVAALQQRGIVQPYTHQAQAIEALARGENIVVVASAAGGKSLCFQAPIFSELLQNPEARALCLFPTKALAQDQLAAFSNQLLAISEQPLKANRSSLIAAYDGDTPQGQRSDIRKAARIIVSNFDMLHVGILPHHTRWSAFLRNLKFVVIDEMHSYRGIFGSHVANVVRRLKRLCTFYGAAPIFILASATIANPKDHAERLIEAPVTLIDDDGSPRGERHVIVVNPPLVDASIGLRKSADFVVRDVAMRFIRAGAQTICFARSRPAAELLLAQLRHVARDWKPGNGDLSDSSTSNLQSLVSGYRGGYLPAERRAIEKGLRDGSVRGVVATNALELGIDIGELDACVLLGYPGTIASFWQQAGRAGRRHKPAAAVMVSTANALDQYLAVHPDFLFKQTPEHARIAPDNLGVLATHVACATFELPFMRGEKLGAAHIDDILDALAEEGDVHSSGGASSALISQPSRYTWVGDTYPADHTSLRGIGERVLIECEGQVIGETERAVAAMRVHVGAVYLHQGQTYQITELDWENGKAAAWKVESDYYTQASSVSEVVVVQEYANGADVKVGQGEKDSAPASPKVGAIEVTTRVSRFRQVAFDTHQVLGWGDVDLPAQHLLTVGYWFAIPEELAKDLEKQGVIAFPNDYGPNWQAQRRAARQRDGFRCVVCGKAEPPEREHDIHHKKPFRTFGYRRGENENYLQANALENLMTVCPDCHARIETAQPVNGALSGLCNLLGNLAPIFVMCDPGDIAAIFDVHSPHTRLPTITIYEMTPGGTGLCEELMLHHAELLQMAAQRLRECGCARGCPACVGPISEEQPRHVKQDTLKLVAALLVGAVSTDAERISG